MPSDPSCKTHFATTRWTLVADAACGSEGSANDALGELILCYWQPLYRYARRKGKSIEDAEDLVQGFVVHLIEAQSLKRADQAKGRFRAFLLTCFKHWMMNEWRNSVSQKRGGCHKPLSLDWESAETGLKIDPIDTRSPDLSFDREWAIALLATVLNKMEAESQANGSIDQFTELKHCLSADAQKIDYGAIALKLGANEGTVRVAVHRMRKNYRTLIKAEVLRTLASPDALEDEMKALFAALSTE